MNKLALVRSALEARSHSYSPYSGFCVGAALLVDNGTVYLGANVENAAFSPSVCAERVAALQAVYDGHRCFRAVAIVGYPRDTPSDSLSLSYPCGVCRQFLREFAHPDMVVLVARSETYVVETTLSALLPHSFGPESLQK